MFVASPKGLSSQILMANWRSFVLGTSLAEAMAAGTLMAREEAWGGLISSSVSASTPCPGCRLDTSLRPFHDRPALALGAGRFAAARSSVWKTLS